MTFKKFINNMEEYLCVWGTVFMTVVVFVQVIMRYVFANSLSWSEEFARFTFLWISWVGASYAVKEGSHFRVEMFVNNMKRDARRYFELFVLVAWFLFCFFLTWYGTKLVIFLVDTGQTSAAMQIPMSWPYASVPVGCGLMCLRLIIEMWKVIKGEYKSKDREKSAVEGGL
ncbi:MAG: TRAP transporter small permease [Synergistaceae bacterium]|nr:TRAP transporter small permease [Synergistaceae bacterium]